MSEYEDLLVAYMKLAVSTFILQNDMEKELGITRRVRQLSPFVCYSHTAISKMFCAADKTKLLAYKYNNEYKLHCIEPPLSIKMKMRRVQDLHAPFAHVCVIHKNLWNDGCNIMLHNSP